MGWDEVGVFGTVGTWRTPCHSTDGPAQLVTSPGKLGCKDTRVLDVPAAVLAMPLGWRLSDSWGRATRPLINTRGLMLLPCWAVGFTAPRGGVPWDEASGSYSWV